MPANAQHACHGDWLFTGVTKPSLRRSYLLGRAACAVSSASPSSAPSSTAHSGTPSSVAASFATASSTRTSSAIAAPPGVSASESARTAEVTTLHAVFILVRFFISIVLPCSRAAFNIGLLSLPTMVANAAFATLGPIVRSALATSNNQLIIRIRPYHYCVLFHFVTCFSLGLLRKCITISNQASLCDNTTKKGTWQITLERRSAA